MGNSNTAVTSGVKAQADAGSMPLYSLVDLNGGGELIEVMKEALRTRDFNAADQLIIEKVKPYLYNDGKGKAVPVIDYVMYRNKERPRLKQLTPKKNENEREPEDLDNVDRSKYRVSCWDIEKRGAVGETCLHTCFLSCSAVHAELAKRLIKHFPRLINDIYMCDEYYGENVLHMAIVNEEPQMVKFLLDNGVDYHERCIGNFFTAEDQKTSRADSLDTEIVSLSLNTEYDGYAHFGEYPLSFAACLSQEGSYRLMLAKGADPDKQDTNGNTALHIMVIHDNIPVFDMVYETGASLVMKNLQALTPLALAAKLARKDMFFHILKLESEVYWQLGKITCVAYPLTYLDSITLETGEIQVKSIMNMVCFGDKKGHIDSLDGPVIDVLQAKWKFFVKLKFYRQFILFAIYFVFSIACHTIRPGPGIRFYPPVYAKQATSDVNATTLASNDSSYTTDPNYFYNDYDIMNGTDTPILADEDLEGSIAVTLNMEQTNIENKDKNVTEERFKRQGMPSLSASHELSGTKGIAQSSFTVKKQTDEITTAMYQSRVISPDDDFSEVTSEQAFMALGGGSDNLEDVLLSMDPRNDTPAEREKRAAVKSRGKKFLRPRRTTIKPAIHTSGAPNASEKNEPNLRYRLMKFTTWTERIRWGLEGVNVVIAIIYILGAIKEIRFLGRKMFYDTITEIPSRVLFLFSCTLQIIMVPLRFLLMPDVEDICAVVVMLLTAPYFLFFCRGFKIVGPFVVMIYKMLAGDLIRFVTIYIVFVMGFAQAYYILYQSFTEPRNQNVHNVVKNPMSGPVESVMAMFLMSLNDFDAVYNTCKYTRHEYLGKTMFLIYIVIVAILLVNLLIAMMGNTYTKIAENKNEWMRQWARIVMIVERGVEPDKRREAMMRYSEPMADGRRCLLIRHQHSAEEKEELKEVSEMHRIHKKYFEKRKNRKPGDGSMPPSPL